MVPHEPDAPGLAVPALPAQRGPRSRDAARADRGAPGQEDLGLPSGQLKLLVDNSPDLIGRYDRDGRRLFVNRALADTLCRTPQELVGTLLTDPSSTRGHGLRPESATRLLAGIREVLDGGEPVQLEAAFDKDGEPTLVHFLLVPLPGPDGRVHDVFAIGRDITSVKRIEQALDDVRRSYRDLFENSLDQMIMLEVCGDGRYRILEMNPAMERAMRWPREQVVGRFQDELYEPAVNRVLADCYQACIDAGEPVQSEQALELPRGQRIFEATTVPAREEDGRIVRVVNIVRDVTERRRDEQARERLDRALRTLSSGNETLIRAPDEASLLTGMCRVMVRVGGYRRAWIGYANEPVTPVPIDSGPVESGPVESASVDSALPPGGLPLCVVPMAWASLVEAEEEASAPDPDWVGPPEPLQMVLRTGDVRLCHPSEGEGPWGPMVDVARRLGIGACLTLPLLQDGKVHGVFVIHAAQPEAFEPDELRLLRELAADLAYGILNLRTRAAQAQHEERMRKAMNATIQALADTTELRDPYTAGHQRRVAQLAEEVGRRMGLPEDRVAGLYLASTIHDIGKICVPAEILGRPGRLSPLEYAMVQQHVVAAYELLKNIEFPWPVADIVGQHHERYDGSGYPAGLAGDQMLLESRILAVCDVVEAMSSHRPYRAGLGMEAALQELQEGRGTRYDPEVVDTCVTMLRKGQFSFS